MTCIEERPRVSWKEHQWNSHYRKMTKRWEQEILNLVKNRSSSTNIQFSDLNSQKLVNDFIFCHSVAARTFFLCWTRAVYCLALKINWCHSSLWQFNRAGFKSNFTTVLDIEMEDEIEFFLSPTIEHCLRRDSASIGPCNNIHQISWCVMERHPSYQTDVSLHNTLDRRLWLPPPRLLPQQQLWLSVEGKDG